MSRRALLWPLVVAFVLLAIQGAVWYWTPARQLLSGPPTPAAITVSGTIEAHESVLSFTRVSAPIVALPFDEGAKVAAGTVLARLDDRFYRQQMATDQAECDAAAAQVAVDEAGLGAARQNVARDLSDPARKIRDLARDQAVVQAAKNAVTLARADLAAAQAEVKQDAIILGYTVLRAPFAGVIAVRQAELGELAGPGVAIVTLDDLDHVWLRADVDEPDLGRIRLGEAATVTIGGAAGKRYPGLIAFISPKAEATPKAAGTRGERVTPVHRIRIELANQDHMLLPGMRADARIVLRPAGRS